MSTAPTVATITDGPHIFTSESVSEGHPDKVCDYIADSILDACLAEDPRSRVACEVLCKAGDVVLAGEITSSAVVDYEAVARGAIREIGYTDAAEAFNADGVRVTSLLTRQSPEIGQGVDVGGAGDQGIMFGYASDETAELMPLPILLAHRLSQKLAKERKSGRVKWLRPDSKTQVSVVYQDGRPVRVATVLVSTQHARDITRDEIHAYVASTLCPEVLGEWFATDLEVLVNPTGSFVEGGPSADCGVTGRKIIVDTYGGMGRHGGGAFSGKDPSKVDRSGAYFGRQVARRIVSEGIAHRAEVQVAYAIGQAQPVSVRVETFGTGDQRAAEALVRSCDFRPDAIIEQLELRRPIYRGTTNYGHFGRAGLPWEAAAARPAALAIVA
ncbi:MAG TPA: methionine adenosyltransferase [Gemmatimonadaceae bacterium]|nr:methionine adenosyltransferase [Gemmatimonadaceae bacterium]